MKWYIYEDKNTEDFESISTKLFSDVYLEEHDLKVTEKESDEDVITWEKSCLLYTSPSPRDGLLSRMPSSA